VARITGSAARAIPTTGVDLSHHPLAHQLRPVRGGFDYADEFVANGSTEAGVTADDLQVGVADPREGDPNESFTRSFRSRDFGDSQSIIRKTERFHLTDDYTEKNVSKRGLRSQVPGKRFESLL
jgi:hypothetical protein